MTNDDRNTLKSVLEAAHEAAGVPRLKTVRNEDALALAAPGGVFVVVKMSPHTTDIMPIVKGERLPVGAEVEMSPADVAEHAYLIKRGCLVPKAWHDRFQRNYTQRAFIERRLIPVIAAGEDALRKARTIAALKSGAIAQLRAVEDDEKRNQEDQSGLADQLRVLLAEMPV